jgi:hypothetical protein
VAPVFPSTVQVFWQKLRTTPGFDQTVFHVQAPLRFGPVQNLKPVAELITPAEEWVKYVERVRRRMRSGVMIKRQTGE